VVEIRFWFPRPAVGHELVVRGQHRAAAAAGGRCAFRSRSALRTGGLSSPGNRFVCFTASGGVLTILMATACTMSAQRRSASTRSCGTPAPARSCASPPSARASSTSRRATASR
jgi:hypothetical protein